MDSDLLHGFYLDDRLIMRDALFDQVWDGKGSQSALERAVSEIRNALGDAPDQSQFIQTLPGTDL